MTEVVAYVVVVAVVIVTTLAATPLVRRLAIHVDAVVRPDERRVHEHPTPTLGGLAMLVGLYAGMFTAWRIHAFDEIFSGSTEPIGILLAATLIVIVGAVDDLREVSAPAKAAGMVLAASVLVIGGTSILVLRIPFQGTFLLSADWSYLISVIWVVGMANAINFIDGLDGLAAGIVGIAAGAFFLYSMQLADAGLLQDGNAGPLVAIIVFGVCIGFLPFNVHPAKIFMGDCGALLLGLLMAASTMVVGGRTDQPFSGQSWFFYAPLLIPLLVLAVPIFDTAFAIVRRATKRKGVATADINHLHHRLMRIGHGHRRSVLILWAWTALLSGFVLYPTITGRGNGVVPIGILAIALLLFTVLHPSMRRRPDAEGGPAGADRTEGESVDDAVVVDLSERRSG